MSVRSSSIKKRVPRGLRNNNPLNIVHNERNKWQGLDKNRAHDGRFCIFVAPEWGYRAAFRIFKTYRDRFDRSGTKFCLRELITRWAPYSENDTEAYISAVSNRCKIRPNMRLNLRNREQMVDVAEAMCWVENGVAGTWSDIVKGYDLAFPSPNHL